MTSLLLRIMLIGFLAAVVPVGARGETFLSALDDVPVMPGLVEDQGAAFVFDTANGRIVTARIVGARHLGLDAGALLAFYAATLPALGWRAETPTRFLRAGEALTLSVEDGAETLALGFELGPD